VKPNPCPNALENGGDGFHSAWDCPAECTYQSIQFKPSPSAACPMPGCHDGFTSRLRDDFPAKSMRTRVWDIPCPWPGHGKDVKP